MAAIELTCPCCQGNHKVHWARIKRVGKAFCLCPSCESVWRRQDDVGVVEPIELGSYLAEAGVADDWRNIRCLEPITQPAPPPPWPI